MSDQQDQPAMTTPGKQHCPVCGMAEDPDLDSLLTHGMYLHFCSAQCRQRFQQRPALYLKTLGHTPAPCWQQNSLTLATPLSHQQVLALHQALDPLMGMAGFEVQDTQLKLRYDLMQLDAATIEQALQHSGIPLHQGWVQRLRRSWTAYQEDGQISSREHTPPPCCNGKQARHDT